MKTRLGAAATLSMLLVTFCLAAVAVKPGTEKKLKPASASERYEPQEGDLIFQSLHHNPLIDAIEGSSNSPFSHCGILHRHKDGRWVVIEAVGPVCQTVLTSWVHQGRDQHYAVFRLKEADRKRIPALIKAAKVYEGRPYDIHYDMDDAAIYCSELIYKAFKTATGRELGKLQTLGELNWRPYVDVIRRIENGYVPLNRKMITPRSVTEAPELELVFTNYPAAQS